MSEAFLPALAAIAPPAGGLPIVGSAASAPWDAPFAPPSTAGAEANSFGAMVREGLASVERQVQASQTDLRQLASGDVENLHQMMIRIEESRLSFQLALQVRNRLLESYQEVMRLQV